MTAPGAGAAGATRACPHCRETILASAEVCPACNHKLRFGGPVGELAAPAALTPLRVEGSFRNPADSGAWEYSMVLTIRNERGEEIARRLVGVGAMQPGEQRTFALSVEMNPASAKRTRH
ncbi:MAG: hypothetical protein J0H27_07535 [Xanthomonadales bacterium]|nr:hypothetical protein [Xanthomonadales bacterium]ODU94102.1 MAG: hypothetical protein ABT18_05450 [Rhodanobacter sp. SCN 66-43]OJY83984.1 MAG: hypothetical protein BGP23_15465 [Xanthomonadales bacterium 66-474]